MAGVRVRVAVKVGVRVPSAEPAIVHVHSDVSTSSSSPIVPDRCWTSEYCAPHAHSYVELVSCQTRPSSGSPPSLDRAVVSCFMRSAGRHSRHSSLSACGQPSHSNFAARSGAHTHCGTTASGASSALGFARGETILAASFGQFRQKPSVQAHFPQPGVAQLLKVAVSTRGSGCAVSWTAAKWSRTMGCARPSGAVPPYSVVRWAICDRI